MELENLIKQVRVPARHLVHNWQGDAGCADSCLLAQLISNSDQFFVYVASGSEEVERVANELRFFGLPESDVLTFPEWETLPYDAFSPHDDLISERLSTSFELLRANKGVLVVSVRSLLQCMPPSRFVRSQSFLFKSGQRFDIQLERQRLIQTGYRHVELVMERGEFAVRGSIVDIFPMGSDRPIRVDLDDDLIDGIRKFDPDSQRTIARLDVVRLLPAKEFPLDQSAIARFREKWHDVFDVDVRHCPIYQEVNDGVAAQGLEYYLPLFFESTETLFDYLPEDCAFVVSDKAEESAKHFWKELDARYESLRHDIERPILPPERLFQQWLAVSKLLKQHGVIQLDPGHKKKRHVVGLGTLSRPNVRAELTRSDPGTALRRYLETTSSRVLFTAESAGRLAHLDEFLRRSEIVAIETQDFSHWLDAGTSPGLVIAPIDRGFAFDDVVVISEAQIFGREFEGRSKDSRRAIDPELVIRNLTELSLGAPVVHVEHGIGRYKGLEILVIDGHPAEFLTLEYAESARLYVPVASLDLISRYAGADHESAPLHTLGTDKWAKEKQRAAEKVRDVAAELLDVYARREIAEGFAFPRPDADYERFCDEFPFELTLDQRNAVDAMIEDLTRVRSADRLICGDVGFGKTEVAMRAAYIASQAGKQVAVLVPTTLLAQQHYETFCDRFSQWPHQIEVVSRMRRDGDVKRLKEKLSGGTVDIIIGTHRLLTSGFDFKDLGLIIIDEEHRFGVRQKERLKSVRESADVLALTATPIPRTLNMAISGMRDLSIIATPPAKRLAIKTFVIRKSRPLIREAIERELSRGGQVFYLHNDVRTIEQAAEELSELYPGARIAVAHGQMPKRRLEKAMADFYHRRCNLLVCSTIIENGIDVPNANTIVIERADKFGLAQLHQLRGRVGRSTRQAYAYLLTPHPKAVSRDARKRLDAIEASGELGIGFTLSTYDLEIRGAGELLGDDQSGQIETVGYTMYMEMLERAVAAIRAGEIPHLDVPLPDVHEVNLHSLALIPEEYVRDVDMRLILYKRIAGAVNDSELNELKIEMVDRFGNMPVAVANLFLSTQIKLSALALGIKRIDLGPAKGRVEFANNTVVDPHALIKLVRESPETYELIDGNRLKINRDLETEAARFRFVEKFIEDLRGEDQPSEKSA